MNPNSGMHAQNNKLLFLSRCSDFLLLSIVWKGRWSRLMPLWHLYSRSWAKPESPCLVWRSHAWRWRKTSTAKPTHCSSTGKSAWLTVNDTRPLQHCQDTERFNTSLFGSVGFCVAVISNKQINKSCVQENLKPYIEKKLHFSSFSWPQYSSFIHVF